MKVLDIGEICERAGLRPSAVRYYEEIGLISSIGRNGLRRQFAPDVLLRLGLISMGKSAGFTLDEIAGMFAEDGQPDLPRETLHQKADALERQIVELKAMRDLVRHVADCPAPTHMECPTFRRLVGLASRRGEASLKRKRAKPVRNGISG